MTDLYSLPLPEDVAFTNHCGGNLGGSNETCVAFVAIPGPVEAFALRDSKPEGADKELRFTTAELDDFVLGYAKQRGLTL
ncbi:hypothetical protein HY68_16300 [Streptomyces sp. AcH 505]|nr:hypothetical protein HY68_16300 [Streptomyces sp. AcH 505]